jgi:pre-mRNA-splicing factor CWC26
MTLYCSYTFSPYHGLFFLRLKQVADQAARVDSALHEMSKPLARYKDDDDLDTHLRNQDRDGDPMLKFIKNRAKSSKS